MESKTIAAPEERKLLTLNIRDIWAYGHISDINLLQERPFGEI